MADEDYWSDNASIGDDDYDGESLAEAEPKENAKELLDIYGAADKQDDESEGTEFDYSEDEDNKIPDDDDAPPKDEDDLDDDEEPEAEPEIDIKSVSNNIREVVVVRPENCMTTDILSEFEQTEIVSIRASQIAKYKNCFVDVSDLDDPVKMAKRELMMRKCPLQLKRPVGEIRDKKSGELKAFVEYRDPNQMQFSIIYKV